MNGYFKINFNYFSFNKEISNNIYTKVYKLYGGTVSIIGLITVAHFQFTCKPPIILLMVLFQIISWRDIQYIFFNSRP